MYFVHGWCIVVLLYPQRVGFGIAYSVTKGNARASISGISKVADSSAFFMSINLGSNKTNNNILIKHNGIKMRFKHHINMRRLSDSVYVVESSTIVQIAR